MARISRSDKYLPEDGSIPKEAKFICKTCGLWFASRTGRNNHVKKFPDHTTLNIKTGFLKLGIPATNGHSTEISPALLEYAFSKMRSTIESELDRLHDQLIPATPEPRRKIYVAR